MQGTGPEVVKGHLFPNGHLEHTPSPAKEKVPGAQAIGLAVKVRHSDPAGQARQSV